MWGSIANFKENLNKIALDVHEADDDGDDELQMYDGVNEHDSDVSHGRESHDSGHSNSNGIDASYISEIEKYKTEIKRLQASEAEIRALSVNYAALLKEKEDHIVRLIKENGSLKQNLGATNTALSVARTEGYGASTNGINVAKGSTDHSSSRQHNFTKQSKNCYTGNQMHNDIVPKDAMNNGVILNLEPDATLSKMDSDHSNLEGKDKDLADLVEGKNSSAAAVQHTAEIRQLKMKLEQEYNKLTNIQLQFQEEQKLNKSLQEELKSLKMERDKTTKEMSTIRNELNEKALEIECMQMELNKQNNEEAMNAMDSLKRLIKTLEKENTALKMEKNELEAALEKSRKSLTGNMSSDASKIQNKDSGSVSEMPDLSLSFPEKEELEQSLQKLSRDLKESQLAKDKAFQQLTRLKQHLLEKESEESEKMDEDRKVIEELRESNNYLRAQISHLERSLKQTIASQEELKMTNNDEIHRSREIIDDLNKKLENCTSTIDAKNIELLNLQTALGQYYAEIEAKEHLEGELARAREESARFSKQLKDADHRAHMSRSERDEILAKLSQSEKVQSEWRSRVTKLEEDNAKLRRALEQSMTQLNRMSVDSDFLVDRRIVIKLLVTYFQRNHSKEVLDLMVRVLGFSDEDKQRIGVAQQGRGKGVVRGVLGLPGRLVGGILGGSSTEAGNAGSDNQSFADLWIDFLLKETEEREKREATGSTGESAEESHGKIPNTISAIPSLSNQMFSTETAAAAASINSSTAQNFMPPTGNYFHGSENFDSEFSNVPLTSSDSKPSEILPRY